MATLARQGRVQLGRIVLENLHEQRVRVLDLALLEQSDCPFESVVCLARFDADRFSRNIAECSQDDDKGGQGESHGFVSKKKGVWPTGMPDAFGNPEGFAYCRLRPR